MMNLKLLGLLALAAAGAGLTGCVERRVTIGSNPSGALVLLNDQEIGRTPVTVPFTWYGDYDVRIRYEKNVGTPEKPQMVRYYLHTHKSTTLPWFEIIPMDLVAGVLPVPFKDEQIWAFVVPEVNLTDDTPTGVRGRLIKLGFACASEGGWGPDLANAVRDFQTSQRLEPSGEFNEATKQALKDAELLQRAQQLKAVMGAGNKAPPQR